MFTHIIPKKRFWAQRGLKSRDSRSNFLAITIVSLYFVYDKVKNVANVTEQFNANVIYLMLFYTNKVFKCLMNFFTLLFQILDSKHCTQYSCFGSEMTGYLVQRPQKSRKTVKFCKIGPPSPKMQEKSFLVLQCHFRVKVLA